MSAQFNETRCLGALHVADVARMADVTPATVRYYVRIKLLTPNRDPENGYKCFSLSDVHRVKFIRQSQSLALTISDIRSILKAVDDGGSVCEQVKSLVSERLLLVQEQIAELQAKKARISEAVAEWRKMSNPVTQEGEFCPLIERVEVTNCREPTAPRRQTQRSPRHEACHCVPPAHDTGRLSFA